MSWTARNLGLSAGVAVIAALAGFGAIYATLGGGDNARAQAQATSTAATAPPTELPRGAGSNPLSQGHMAAFVWKKEPEALPDVTFVDGSGSARTLADWKGRVVLLNLWATWCAPCRKEMPALERLQKELGSDSFEVVALSIDRGGADAAKKFLDQIKVEKLGLYVDQTARASSALKAVGMPTTLLIDRQGRELGRLVGPAEWDSADAVRLVKAALSAP
jgi:thiol-disulfide isomerase/thioredoxin